MSSDHPREAAHLTELLAAQATEGINPRARTELEGLLASAPSIDGETLDRAAAAVDKALHARVEEPLPTALRAKLIADARAFFQQSS